MVYQLVNKCEKPDFLYYVKENTSSFDYYLFHDYEKAMECARILSLTKFPIAIIREPMQDAYGEWHLEQTHSYVKGECHYKDEYVKQCSLHAKFYLDAGEWLNPGDDVQINSDMEVCIGEEMD